ncbi:hypothetical protein [Pseudomonas asiatica]|uniref:hypothetical protein n=1 Tax=Pseudomonas asiatica TaxID=2219225 RepID=UPI0010C13B69|nr:hypothetical protein [Pseudomonas asiatica]
MFEITLLKDGAATIKPISVQMGRDLLQHQQYKFEGRHIKRGGRLVALVDIEVLYNRGQYGGTVSFSFESTPSRDEETDFKQIALCLSSRERPDRRAPDIAGHLGQRFFSRAGR